VFYFQLLREQINCTDIKLLVCIVTTEAFILLWDELSNLLIEVCVLYCQPSCPILPQDVLNVVPDGGRK
jgi:hypothetical protein